MLSLTSIGVYLSRDFFIFYFEKINLDIEKKKFKTFMGISYIKNIEAS